MPDDSPVVSISSNPSMNPEEIARKTFPPARRGLDGEAVRRYLEAVSRELRDLLEREAMLRRRVAEAERRAAEPEIDEAMLTRALGSETARIFQAAHDAARDLIARAEEQAGDVLSQSEGVLEARLAEAEERAGRVLSDATERAEALTAGATTQVEDIVEAARAEAEALTEAAQREAVVLLDSTKQGCRLIIRQARQLRQEVLGDLTAQRHGLYVQLEQLRTGRDVLVEVVEAVGGAVDEVRQRLASAEHDARMAAAEAGDRADAADQVEQAAKDFEAELSSGDLELITDLEAEGEGSAFYDQTFEDELGDGEASGRRPRGDSELALELAVDEGLAGELGEDTLAGDAEAQAQETAASHRSVGELFARIRASRSAEVAEAGELESGEATAGAKDSAAGLAAEVSESVEEAAGVAVAPGSAAQPASEAEASPATQASPASPATQAEASPASAASPAGAASPATQAEASPASAASAASPAGAASPATQAEASPATQASPASPATQAERADGPAAGEGIASSERQGSGAAEAVSAHRAAVEEAEARPDDDQAGEHPGEPRDADAAALARRTEMLAPVSTRLGRALKRALQDDQNELLDAIRNAAGTPDLERLLPAANQTARLESAVTPVLAHIWVVGRPWLRGSDTDESVSAAELTRGAAEAAAVMATELAAELSGLLRHRLVESLGVLGDISEGAQDVAGAAYREWKGQRIEALAGDFALRAFSAGAVSAAEGTAVRWVMDDDGQPCPDCDDNVLAGEQAAGEDFPTGQPYPPVHPGCRCLIVAAG